MSPIRGRMSIAFIFPGQGSQAVGMGAELAEAYPAARAVFEEIDAALGQNSVAADVGGAAERAARSPRTRSRR